MHRVRMRYAASRRHAQRGVPRNGWLAREAPVGEDRNAWRALACPATKAAPTTAHAVVPRHSAINDGEGEVGARLALISISWVAPATLDCRWNSCRKIATRCQ